MEVQEQVQMAPLVWPPVRAPDGKGGSGYQKKIDISSQEAEWGERPGPDGPLEGILPMTSQ